MQQFTILFQKKIFIIHKYESIYGPQIFQQKI